MARVGGLGAEIAFIRLVGSRYCFVERSSLELEPAEKGLIGLFHVLEHSPEFAIEVELHHPRLWRRHTAGCIKMIGQRLAHECRIAPSRIQVQAMSSFKRLVMIEKDLERLFRPTARPLSPETHSHFVIKYPIGAEAGRVGLIFVSRLFER